MKEKENKWNPALLWRVLRLTKSYRTAFDEFKEQIKKVRNNELKTAFRVFNEEDSSGMMNSERKRYLVQSKHKHFINSRILFYINHYSFGRKFLDWYGDVLWFPIDYNLKNPNAFILNGVWVYRAAFIGHQLYPAAFSELRNKIKGYPPLQRVDLFFNLNFTDSEILKATNEYLLSWIKERRGGYNPNHRLADYESRWDGVEDAIRILEIEQDGIEKGEKLTLAEVFDRTGRKLSKHADPKSKANIVNGLKKRFPLKNLFERVEPPAANWK